MDGINADMGTLNEGEATRRTPAYAGFEANTDRLLYLLEFINFGVTSSNEDAESRVRPEIARLSEKIKRIGEERSRHAKAVESPAAASATEAKSDSIVEIVKEAGALVTSVTSRAGGYLFIREWIPVLLVTIVETYLKDVLTYAAKEVAWITKRVGKKASLSDVSSAESLEDLAKTLHSRWARKQVDKGGPRRWIEKLLKDVKTYDAQTAERLETLWGVRHVVVHSAGIATADFVRRHPAYGAAVGRRIVVRNDYLKVWLETVYHFVEATDLWVVQRGESDAA